MRLTIAARAETAKKLIKSGLSQREAARLLGVNHKTIQRDVAHNAPKSGAKSAATNKPATRARRAAIAENAAAAGVTVLPTERSSLPGALEAWAIAGEDRARQARRPRGRWSQMVIANGKWPSCWG